MNTKRFKIAGLIALSLVLMVVMAACDTGVVDDDDTVVDETYNVVFNVSPEDATVEFDGETKDATNGTATFEDVEDGTYDYTVSAEGYVEESGSVVVDGEDASVTVELGAEPLAVEAVADIDTIDVAYGTTKADIPFPEEVEVTLTDGTTEDVDLKDWVAKDTYSPTQPGGYIFEAELDLSGVNATNPEDLKASARVQVAPEEDAVVVSVESLEDVVVEHGTEASDLELPKQVTVTIDTGDDVRKVPVDWDLTNYDGEEAGTYTLEGTLNLDSFNKISNPNDVKAEIDVVVEEEVFTGELTGEIERIYDGGHRIEIDGEVWDVAAMPGFRGYLNRMSAPNHAILGSEFTVTIEDNLVTDLTKITLEDKSYTHREMNDMVNTNNFYGVTIEGQEAGSTAVVAGAEAQADVDGNTVTAAMDQLTVRRVDFDLNTLTVTGDDVVFEDLDVVANLVVDTGFAFEADLNKMEGNVNIANGLDAVVTVDEIDGNVTIADDSATFNVATITGNLNVAAGGTRATLNISNAVLGNVILGQPADITGIEIQGGLTIDAADITVEDLEVDGALTVNGNNATVRNSSFGMLADNNNGINATLDTVEFDTVYEDIDNTTNTELSQVNNTFTVNLDGWSFKDMTWPVETIDPVVVSIDSDNVDFTNAAFTGDVTANGTNASFDGSTFAADLTINNTFVTVNDFMIEGTLDINNAATITDGSIVGASAGVNNIAANTNFDEVTFDFDSSVTLPVNIVEDGISFTDVTFKDAVDVNVDSLIADEEVLFEQANFENDSTFTVDSANAVDSDVTMNGVFFHNNTAFNIANVNDAEVTVTEADFAPEVAFSLESDARVTFNDTIVEFDSDNPMNLEIPANSVAQVRFDEDSHIYRPVVAAVGADAVRFFDTNFYNDMTIDNNDTRVENSTFNADEDLDLDGGGILVLRTVDFVGSNDIDIDVSDLMLRGDIVGNDIVTVSTAAGNVDFGFELFAKGIEFDDTAPYSINKRDVTLEDVQFSDVAADLSIDELDAVLKNVEVGQDLFVNAEDAELDEVVVGNDLAVNEDNATLMNVDVGNDLSLDAGATLTNVDVTANILFDSGDLELTDVDADEVSFVDYNGFDLTWTGGEVSTNFDLNYGEFNADTSLSFTDLEVVLLDLVNDASGGDYEVSFSNGIISQLTNSLTNDPVEAEELVFSGVTFDTNKLEIDFPAEFKEAYIDNIDLEINDAAAEVEVVGGTITELNYTDAEELSISNAVIEEINDNIDFEATFVNNVIENDSTDITISNDDAVFTENTFAEVITDISGTASFTGNTFEENVDAISALATFEGNEFEGTVDVNVDDVEFKEDKFYGNITVINNDVVFNDVEIDATDLATELTVDLDGDYAYFNDITIISGDEPVADAPSIKVNIANNLRIENATFIEAGDAFTELELLANAELLLRGEINWEDADNLVIDASDPTATVDDTATWIPDDSPVVQVLGN